jgi:hypothetical protein
MIDQELHDRLNQLKEEINYHNYRYHVMDSPVISDYEYDKLINELKEMNLNTLIGSLQILLLRERELLPWINLSKYAIQHQSLALQTRLMRRT